MTLPGSHLFAWTLEDFYEFQAAYTSALEKGAEEFVFNNQRILTSYAKHLLEYLTKYFEES